MNEYERSRLIVQLRCEIALDAERAFEYAATSVLRLEPEQKLLLQAIAIGYGVQHRLLKSTLDLGKKK